LTCPCLIGLLVTLHTALLVRATVALYLFLVWYGAVFPPLSLSLSEVLLASSLLVVSPSLSLLLCVPSSRGVSGPSPASLWRA
jgi:hypothetical protein